MQGREVTSEKHRNIPQAFIDNLWEKGKSGNPKGRPLGSRNRLADDFITDVYNLWKTQGKEILQRTAEKNPEVVVKLIGQMIPKELLVTNTNNGSAMLMMFLESALNGQLSTGQLDQIITASTTDGQTIDCTESQLIEAQAINGSESA